MSGAKYLLDTNIVIGILKKYQPVVSLIKEKNIQVSQCGYSNVTRMELLGFPSITQEEEAAIVGFLSAMPTLCSGQAVKGCGRMRSTSAGCGYVFDITLCLK